MSVAVLIVAVSMVPTVTVLVLLAALGTIAGLVLRGAHEIHRSVAGVVLVAVLAPVLGMARRDVQIDRLHRHRLSHHHGHRDDRLRVDERRWRAVTQYHLPVHARSHFAGDARVVTYTLRDGQGHGRRPGQARLQHETDPSQSHSFTADSSSQ